MSAVVHLAGSHMQALRGAIPAFRVDQLPLAARKLLAEQQAAKEPEEPQIVQSKEKEDGKQGHVASPPGLEDFLLNICGKLGDDLTEDGVMTLRELASHAEDVGPARRALLAALEAGASPITRPC